MTLWPSGELVPMRQPERRVSDVYNKDGVYLYTVLYMKKRWFWKKVGAIAGPVKKKG